MANEVLKNRTDLIFSSSNFDSFHVDLTIGITKKCIFSYFITDISFHEWGRSGLMVMASGWRYEGRGFESLRG